MPIKSVRIREISDVTVYGFARALAEVQMTPSVMNASAKISIDVPVQYTDDMSVADVRSKVMAQVIASLREAAETLPRTPVPRHGLQPSDPPETPAP